MRVRQIRLMAVAAIFVAASPAASSPTLAASPGSSNPCAPGEAWLRPTSVEHRADGGTINDYWRDGVLTQVPLPPASFKPLTASAADLAAYGFPPRPDTQDELIAWQSDLASWKPTPDIGACEVPGLTAAFNNPIWSGYDADSTSSSTYIAVQGDYHQPTKGSTSCASPQEVSWVGLGGYHTGRLMQDGTGIDATGHYYAWYEWLNDTNDIGITKMASVTVHAGDRIHTYVVHQTSGSGQTTFYVADNTTGTSQSRIVNLGSAYYDGSSAEMIDERPSIGGIPTNLTNFGTVNWTNAKVQRSNATWYTLGSQTNVEFDMWATNFSHILAFPDVMSSSTTFSDTWYRCQ
jgi:peptidase A4-like protein